MDNNWRREYYESLLPKPPDSSQIEGPPQFPLALKKPPPLPAVDSRIWSIEPVERALEKLAEEEARAELEPMGSLAVPRGMIAVRGGVKAGEEEEAIQLIPKEEIQRLSITDPPEELAGYPYGPVDFREFIPYATQTTFRDYLAAQGEEIPRKATIDAISILRAEKFLGSAPSQYVKPEEEKKVDWGSRDAMRRFLQRPTPEAHRLREGKREPGLLHPLVGYLAWGAGCPERWEAVPRGVRALASVIWDPLSKDGQLRGMDFKELRRLAGGSEPWISLRKSMFLIALANRAAEREPNDKKLAENLELLLSTETIRRILWRAEPRPASSIRDPEEALAWTWSLVERDLKEAYEELDKEDMKMGERGLPMFGLRRRLKLDFDEKGHVVPITFGENPRWWAEAPLKWASWQYDTAIRKAQRRGDDLLALELARQKADRWVRPGFTEGADFPTALWRLGRSAGEALAAPIILAFSGIASIGTHLGWGVGALLEDSPRSLMRLDNKYEGAKRAMLESAWHMIKAIPEDVQTLIRVAAPKDWGARIQTYKDYARVTTEWEYAPIRPLLSTVGLGGLLVRGSGALLHATTSRNLGVLNRLRAGWSQSSKEWHAITDLGNIIKGAGQAADIAGSWFRARKLNRALSILEETGEELVAKEISSLQQLEQKTRELARQEAKLARQLKTGDATTLVQLEAVQTQLAALRIFQDQVAGAMHTIGKAAAAPGWGRWIRKWFLRPSLQEVPPLADKLMRVLRGLDQDGIRELFGRLDTALEQFRNLGATRRWGSQIAVAMLEGIADVGAMIEWRLDRGYGSLGKRILAATDGKTATIAGTTYDLAQETAAAAKAGISLEEHLGGIAAEHLRRIPIEISVKNAADEIAQFAAANDLTLGQGMFRWFTRHLAEQEAAGKLQLPNIPGLSPEAIRFAMALEFAVPHLGTIKSLAGDAFKFGAFYDQLLEQSPMLKLLPQEARDVAALEILRQLRPRLYGVPAFEGDIIVAKGPNVTVRVPQETILRTFGSSIQDIAEYAYQTGIDLVEADLMPLEALKEYGLQWWHRQFAGFKPSELKTQLIKFVDEGARLGEKRWRKQVVGEVKAGRRTYLPERDDRAIMLAAAVLGKAADLVRRRELFVGSKFRLADVGETARITGRVGRELHAALYQTSPESILEVLSNMHTLRSYAQTIKVLRAEGLQFARRLDEVLSADVLSDDTVSYLASQGVTVDLTRLDSRVAGAVKLLENTDVVTLSPRTREQIGDILTTAGWKSLGEIHRKLWGKKAQSWTDAVMLSPHLSYVLEYFDRTVRKPRGFWDKATRIIKANQIVGRPGPWFRDYISNLFVLGPANGLWPYSPAWKLSPRVLETPNVINQILSTAGIGRATVANELSASVGTELAGSLMKQLFALARERGKIMWTYRHPSRWLEGIVATAEWVGRAIAHPTSISEGNWLRAHRGMTDMIPRAALFMEELLEAGRREGLNVAQLVREAADAEKITLGRNRPRAVIGALHNKGPTYEALSLLDDLASALRKRAQKEGKAKGYRGTQLDDYVSAEVGRAISRPFEQIVARVPKAEVNAIVEKIKAAFVDYTDKSTFLDAVTRTPFGPIYLTFSAKAIPMVFRWLTDRPVMSYAMLGVWDSVVSLLNYLAEEPQNVQEWRESLADWLLPMPTGTTDVWRMGTAYQWKSGVGIDLAWMSPSTFGFTQLHPAFSPAGSAILQLAQISKIGQDVPIAQFPPANYIPGGGIGQWIVPRMGGEPLADVMGSPTEQMIQTINSVMGQFMPATGSVGWGAAQKVLNRAISDITGTDFTLGPGGPEVVLEPTLRPFGETVTSARKQTSPLPGRMGPALLRALGVKTIPLSLSLERLAGTILAREEEKRVRQRVHEQTAAEQEADLAALEAIRLRNLSPFDHVLHFLDSAMKTVLDDAENERVKLRNSYEEFRKKEVGKRTGLQPEENMRIRELNLGIEAARRLRDGVIDKLRSIFNQMEDLAVDIDQKLPFSDRRAYAAQVRAVLQAVQTTVADRALDTIGRLLHRHPAKYTNEELEADIVRVLAGVGEALQMPITAKPAREYEAERVRIQFGRAAYNFIDRQISPSTITAFHNAQIVLAKYLEQAKAMPEAALKQVYDASFATRTAQEADSPFLGLVPGAEPTERLKERKRQQSARIKIRHALEKERDRKLIPGAAE